MQLQVRLFEYDRGPSNFKAVILKVISSDRICKAGLQEFLFKKKYDRKLRETKAAQKKLKKQKIKYQEKCFDSPTVCRQEFLSPSTMILSAWILGQNS
jgi:hypothetical protein